MISTELDIFLRYTMLKIFWAQTWIDNFFFFNSRVNRFGSPHLIGHGMHGTPL